MALKAIDTFSARSGKFGDLTKGINTLLKMYRK